MARLRRRGFSALLPPSADGSKSATDAIGSTCGPADADATADGVGATRRAFNCPIATHTNEPASSRPNSPITIAITVRGGRPMPPRCGDGTMSCGCADRAGGGTGVNGSTSSSRMPGNCQGWVVSPVS